MKKNLFVLLPILAIVIGFSLLYNILVELEEQTIEHEIVQEKVFAKQAAKGIETFFKFYRNTLQSLTQFENIKELDSEGEAILANFYTNHKEYIRGITRLDNTGKIIFTYPLDKNAVGKDVSYQEHNALMLRQQQPIVSDVFMTVQGFEAVVYLFPILNNNQFNGWLSILIPFEIIAENYLGDIKLGDGGYAILLSEKGIELFCPVDGHVGKSIFETSSKFPSVIEMGKRMQQGDSGEAVYHYDMIADSKVKILEKLAVFQPIYLENTFWSVAVSIPKDELLVMTNNVRRNLFATLFLTSATIFIVLFIYYKSNTRNQNKLKNSEQKLRTIAEQTGQLIYEYDIETGNISFSGAIEEITGFSDEELNNSNIKIWTNLLYESDKEKVLEQLDESIKELKKFHAVYQLCKKDGERIYIEDNGIFEPKISDKIPRMLGIIKDITPRIEAEKELISHRNELENLVARRTRELKMANEELLIDIKKRKITELALLEAKDLAERSDRLKSEFLAQISHEIRTPINIILNYSSLIKYELEDKLSSELDGGFESIENAAHRLLRTIDLILNMSEIETGSYEPKHELVVLYDEVLQPLYLEFLQMAKSKGLELNVLNDFHSVVTISVDRYTVTQIFENLINNAIKYTENGKVDIKLYHDAQYVMVEVNDTGIGIAEEFIPQMFTKFRQEEQGYSRKFEGNGLGLAIVGEYCKINSASIDIESEKGVGSSFKVTFQL